MNKLVKSGRLAAITVFFALLLIVYLVVLYKLQIVEGKAYYEQSRNNIVTTERVPAARGNILDRYGRILVENRTCNNLVINEKDLFETEGTDPNAAILQLVNTVLAYGDTYTDTLPITKEPPFEYTEMTSIQRAFLKAYLNDKKLPENTTAVELMAFMRDRYGIDNSYTAEETRIIAGIRYEINGRYSYGFATSDYVFAEDVSLELITKLMEMDVPGFEVETSFVREYNTAYAPHILGYIGMMTGEEYKKTYEDLDYSYDAKVGKDGAEYAFESWLHGTDGEIRKTSTATGVVTSAVYTQEPLPGNHVYLTIDIGLQEAAENALNSYITQENDLRSQVNAELDLYGGNEADYRQLITGGAAVVVDVATGEPLAIASWPSYDITELMDHFTELMTAENAPLFNHALQGIYAPGSTFKPCTAIAGLTEGKIDLTTTIECEGRFTKYIDAGYAPKCWIYGKGEHGIMDVTSAITNSCNYFFYTVGDYLQISLLAKYAKLFGLGEDTGIELYEDVGVMSTDQYMQEKYGRDMYAGDTIQAAIGQAESLFNPLQMAEYCATVANGGTRHTASVLKSVRTYDFSSTIYDREPEVLSVIDCDPEYFKAVQAGMRGVVSDPVVGTCYNTFLDASYTSAAKTGTAQVGEGKTNNGIFICYAPYENPEIAVAIMVEKGSAGSATAIIARNIMDFYFSFKNSTASMENDGELLP